jgi:5-methyltetrahydropteroyltriglutamate--homocysteine methyltransferase
LLWLGKCKGGDFDRLQLLPALLQCYAQLLQILAREGVEWLQLDEPILALDLPANWLESFAPAYQQLARAPLKIMLASYFGSVARHAALLNALPLAGLHLDLVRAPEQLPVFAEQWPTGRVLSAGIVDGRNIWRSNLSAQLALLEPLAGQLGDTLWLAPAARYCTARWMPPPKPPWMPTSAAGWPLPYKN